MNIITPKMMIIASSIHRNEKIKNRMKKVLVVLIIIIGSSLQAQNRGIGDAASPSVRISSGIVRGIAQDGVAVFKGIPYAAPPVGEYRWRPPQPVIPWEGIRDALAFGPDCAQGGWGTAPGTIREGSSEDCLYLNLWIPAGARPKNKLPVMVWIHGGDFVGGSGASAVTSGEAFAKQGIILMTFNYRLGRLGHFAFPALSAEHTDEPKGSYAFMDMIAALEWVRDNISAFGGDPGNVTVFGESAGGVSVHSLLSVPSAKGLFHKAIIESAGNPNGNGLPEWPLYNPQSNEIIEFRLDGSAAGTLDPKKARLDVIEKWVDPKKEPLVIDQQGSFAVGGSVISNPGTFNPITRTPEGQTFHGDHAYITYQIPVKSRKLPLVFWHGIGQFSKTWETTPDGREGFQNIFLRRGFSVYLITQPRRGNAGRSTVLATINPTPDEQEWFSTFRLGVWPDFFEGVQFDRSEEALNQFFRQMTPNIGGFDTQVITSAISELFDKIGNGILVTHSHSGGFGWLTAIDNPNVKAIVSYEPGSGFVFPEGEVPDPIPGSSGALTADGVSMEDFMKLTKIPIIIYYGDFIPEKQIENPGIDGWRTRLEMARKWRDVVNKYGGDVTVVHLPEIGIKGNTHFPFSDLNNVEIADLMSEWLKSKELDK
ncbi:hypothetical protein C0T31_08965 [Dysgonamonadaceae bacterium]|jgi:hypothetical protein|nr:hypothetical protein C0T31_08965 [Dysgonamonadaceae bacterium]